MYDKYFTVAAISFSFGAIITLLAMAGVDSATIGKGLLLLSALTMYIANKYHV